MAPGSRGTGREGARRHGAAWQRRNRQSLRTYWRRLADQGRPDDAMVGQAVEAVPSCRGDLPGPNGGYWAFGVKRASRRPAGAAVGHAACGHAADYAPSPSNYEADMQRHDDPPTEMPARPSTYGDACPYGP